MRKFSNKQKPGPFAQTTTPQSSISETYIKKSLTIKQQVLISWFFSIILLSLADTICEFAYQVTTKCNLVKTDFFDYFNIIVILTLKICTLSLVKYELTTEHYTLFPLKFPLLISLTAPRLQLKGLVFDCCTCEYRSAIYDLEFAQTHQEFEAGFVTIGVVLFLLATKFFKFKLKRNHWKLLKTAFSIILALQATYLLYLYVLFLLSLVRNSFVPSLLIDFLAFVHFLAFALIKLWVTNQNTTVTEEQAYASARAETSEMNENLKSGTACMNELRLCVKPKTEFRKTSQQFYTSSINTRQSTDDSAKLKQKA